MPLPGRRLFAALGLAAAAMGVASGAPGAAAASIPQASVAQMEAPKYAAIVVDANTGEVLFQRKASDQRYPASITKVMTLYLTFEALATGRLHMDDQVPFSTWATQQAPSKLGVPAGHALTVRQAILGLTVKSANDAAVALAERVGGTEARFAQLMSLRAQELGMSGTRYVNANGLPDSRQVTNARDIAVLARAVMRDYPQYYGFFDQPSMTWEGHVVTNPHGFLRTIPNVDGLKTGFTNAAGHNLVASAVRNGRRLVTVVLGASSSAARDENVADLMEAGFTVLDRRARGDQVNVASLLDAPDVAAGPLSRPLTEMGSAHDPELAMVARAAPEPMPLRIAVRPAPPAPVASATGGCRHAWGRALRRCRAAAVDARREAFAAVAPPCGGRHDRHARACRRAEAIQVAAGPDCAGGHGRRARACRAQGRETRIEVAADAPDCAGRHARRSRACRAERRAVETAAVGCQGRHGRHASACRGEAAGNRLAQAETRAGRRHHGVETAGLGTHGRRRHAAEVADAAPAHSSANARLVKAHLAASSACRKHPHAHACRAFSQA